MGDRTLPGDGCDNLWEGFDPFFVGDSPVDLLRFIEEDGKTGVVYPAVNLTAWRI